MADKGAATYGAAALTGSGGLERLLGTGLPGRLVGVDGAVS
jgi:hypothetical protein